MIPTLSLHLLLLSLFQLSSQKTLKLSSPLSGYRGPLLRFLLHVLPAGFHRIRHYGLLANTTRKDNLAQARELLMDSTPQEIADAQTKDTEGAHAAESGVSLTWLCPDCGAPMIILQSFERVQLPRAPPGPVDAA
jgi:hypothetical protein